MKKIKFLSALSIALCMVVLIGSFSFAGAVVEKQDAQEYEKTFTVSTYNVGGLPLVGSSSKDKSTLIAQEISKIDIVNVQENFTYNKLIRKNLSSDIISQTDHISGKFVGMDTFSSFTIKNVGYEKWDESYGGIVIGGGADIYASKGIRYLTVVLPDGSELDIYNFHTDADGEDTAEDKNLAARRSNLSQLAQMVNERSVSQGRAVIVMGDSNSRYTRINDDFKNLLIDTCGLTDAWVELVRDGVYPEKDGNALTVEGTPAVELSTENKDTEKVDKILYRSSDSLELSALSYADLQLTDSNGEYLSDHNPLVVKFGYKSNAAESNVNANMLVNSAKVSKISSLFSSKKVVKVITTADAKSVVIKDSQNNEIKPVSVSSKTDENYKATKWTVKLDKSTASGQYTVSVTDSFGRVSNNTVDFSL